MKDCWRLQIIFMQIIKNVTLEDLSEKFFLSKTIFVQKYIKEKSGMTFGDILKQIRMKKRVQCLEAGMPL